MSRTAPASAEGIRPEIQVLRAIAVMAVVLFHLWPDRLPGGYVGVDVFFVISGYLITAHLLRQVDRTGTISLREFWARRARRLLPAALLVLLATLVAVFVWAPQTLWSQFIRSIVASALYVGNWQLAVDAVDYLAADNEASPAQHYWSLSVEEQFYLVWPLLILLGILLASRVARLSRRAAITWVLGTVVAASFAYSIVFTATDPAFAYFFTPIRAWEFGAGGLLALVPAARLGRAASVVVSVLGLALIAVSAFAYNPGTAFPGYAAALPVAGTVLVILAGTPTGWYGRVLGLRPVQWLGDISYSTYLWHWPPIILLPFVLGGWLSLPVKLGVLVATIVLAWLTKRYVEDPVRSGRLARARPWKTYVATLVAMAIVVAPGLGGLVVIQQRAAAEQAEAGEAVATPCFGAAAIIPANAELCATDDPLGDLLVPDPAALADDVPSIYNDTCRTAPRSPELLDCVFEPASGEAVKTVALVGDSHTAQWFPLVEALAQERGWTLRVFFKGNCPFTAGTIVVDDAKIVSTCGEWNAAVTDRLAELAPAAIVTSAQTRIPVAGPDGEGSWKAAAAGFSEQWNRVLATGTRVVVLEDTPQMTRQQLECAAAPRDLLDDCRRARDEAIDEDAHILRRAADQTPGVEYLDLTDAFCLEQACPAVLGHVIAYRDTSSHLTRTFVESLVPLVGDRLAASVDG